MKVWALNTSDIDFSSFYLPEEGEKDYFVSLLDDIDDNNSSLRESWESLILLKQKQEIDPDFLDIYDSGAIIVNSKGKSLLNTLLMEGSFELLPFLNDEDEYYLFNLFTWNINGLNKKRSHFNLFPNGTISAYDVLFFNYMEIAKTPVFKIPELPYTLFCTYEFEQAYEEMGLKGINFEDNLVFAD